ncbi:helix-turn-helix transcriptional regulator, partial [Bradyrhizobium sp. 1]|nr:helix-turn-helix transcriptional regulator [Bradyrhizobium sp. 1]
MLVEERKIADGMFLPCIGQTLAMHVAYLEVHKPKVNALPKWRLRLVEDHIKLHFDRNMRLSDLAKIAGLSRMHFAAQFRAATGYRPREYILYQRVERAKAKLSDTDMPIAGVRRAGHLKSQGGMSAESEKSLNRNP